ncbi:MAG: DNA-processing protein DprA, partial [Demequinaceae bacterium]|nr:DNA-processing protein DprA [Demequinaceae bacterium]
GPGEALSWAKSAVTDPIGASLDLGEAAPRDLTDRAIASVERWWQRRTAWDPDPHLERAAKVGARVVARGDPEWPAEICDLGDAAPYCLWVRGSADIREAWARSVAVVGSRSSTAYGEHVAATLAAELADGGHVVVSGGAYGIDARAHRGALAAGGTTVAVMAGGVDRLYPAGNADLLGRVLEAGAIVGELPPGYAPHRSRFLTRNRIIAAARATVVVEAAHRSGALSTAFHAAGLGRPVTAVPGPVTSAGSTGCHRLIRDGAVLVTCARDILDLVEPLDATRGSGFDGSGGDTMTFSSAEHRQAYDAISRRGSTVGEVAAGAGLSVAGARSALGGLLLADLVLRDGVLWRRTSNRT